MKMSATSAQAIHGRTFDLMPDAPPSNGTVDTAPKATPR